MGSLKKFLSMSAEGYYEEQQPSDLLDLGGLGMSGDITMGANKITGLGAATATNDALAYGQSGALLSGLTLSGGNLDLSSIQKVVNSVAPTAPGDLANKAYVDTMAITGGQIKEAVASEKQLVNALGIVAAEVLFFSNQPGVGDTVVLQNSALTRTYTFVANIAGEATATDVSIETSALTAMQRFILRVMADPGNVQWNLNLDLNSQRLNPAGYIIVVAEGILGGGVSNLGYVRRTGRRQSC
jgi:hypothetical protein